MEAFFAKRGISLCGALVARKKTQLEIESESSSVSSIDVKFFDFVGDHTKEDSPTTASIAEGLFQTITTMEEYKNIKSYYLYTDGAGCFSGTEFALWLSGLASTTGMRCIRHHVSESGGGKTTLDCHFSYLMNHLLKAVKEGQGSLNITDSSSALRALCHDGGLPSSYSFKLPSILT